MKTTKIYSNPNTQYVIVAVSNLSLCNTTMYLVSLHSSKILKKLEINGLVKSLVEYAGYGILLYEQNADGEDLFEINSGSSRRIWPAPEGIVGTKKTLCSLNFNDLSISDLSGECPSPLLNNVIGMIPQSPYLAFPRIIGHFHSPLAVKTKSGLLYYQYYWGEWELGKDVEPRILGNASAIGNYFTFSESNERICYGLACEPEISENADNEATRYRLKIVDPLYQYLQLTEIITTAFIAAKPGGSKAILYQDIKDNNLLIEYSLTHGDVKKFRNPRDIRIVGYFNSHQLVGRRLAGDNLHDLIVLDYDGSHAIIGQCTSASAHYLPGNGTVIVCDSNTLLCFGNRANVIHLS